MEENIRTFVAIDFGQELKNKINELYKELSPLSTFVKWTKPENIHITLKFFGAFPTNKLNLLYNILKRTLNEIKPFNIKISGIGAFPNLKKPQIIWIGITEGAYELQTLQTNLDKHLISASLCEAEKKPFNPHITIARIKSSVGINKYIDKIDFNNQKFINIGIQNVNELRLIKSMLTSSGPEYSLVKAFPFKGKILNV
ncbi:MAG: RNA 2',3'-cyclic phosphodiesterase [Candidatus Firestonebacteria bacterium]|nr:RNA 2',3'-cyclic phosphodiesterase [Candidatus Firestonebacteria bacterium]